MENCHCLGRAGESVMLGLRKGRNGVGLARKHLEDSSFEIQGAEGVMDVPVQAAHFEFALGRNDAFLDAQQTIDNPRRAVFDGPEVDQELCRLFVGQELQQLLMQLVLQNQIGKLFIDWADHSHAISRPDIESLVICHQ
jgi:hypothetical protein